jgi:hypothetical protein
MKTSNIIGVVFIIPGAYMAFKCVNDLAHCTTIMFISTLVMIATGCTIFDGTTVTNALKSLAGIAAPYIPEGGRRRSDPDCRPDAPPPSDPKG